MTPLHVPPTETHGSPLTPLVRVARRFRESLSPPTPPPVTPPESPFLALLELVSLAG